VPCCGAARAEGKRPAVRLSRRARGAPGFAASFALPRAAQPRLGAALLLLPSEEPALPCHQPGLQTARAPDPARCDGERTPGWPGSKEPGAFWGNRSRNGEHKAEPGCPRSADLSREEGQGRPNTLVSICLAPVCISLTRQNPRGV